MRRPFLALLLPLIAGIVLGGLVPVPWLGLWMLALGLSLVCLILRPPPSALVVILVMLAGWGTTDCAPPGSREVTCDNGREIPPSWCG